MSERELEILKCKNRIELLMGRNRENRAIVAKLQRRLRSLKKDI